MQSRVADLDLLGKTRQRAPRRNSLIPTRPTAAAIQPALSFDAVTVSSLASDAEVNRHAPMSVCHQDNKQGSRVYAYLRWMNS